MKRSNKLVGAAVLSMTADRTNATSSSRRGRSRTPWRTQIL